VRLDSPASVERLRLLCPDPYLARVWAGAGAAAEGAIDAAAYAPDLAL